MSTEAKCPFNHAAPGTAGTTNRLILTPTDSTSALTGLLAGHGP